jgi:DNA anti-recombination protein RmuC
MSIDRVIAELLVLLIKRIDHMSVTLDALNAAIAQATTDTATLLADIQTQITALQAQITALQGSQTTVDLSGPLAAIQALDATVKAATPAPTNA